MFRNIKFSLQNPSPFYIGTGSNFTPMNKIICVSRWSDFGLALIWGPWWNKGTTHGFIKNWWRSGQRWYRSSPPVHASSTTGVEHIHLAVWIWSNLAQGWSFWVGKEISTVVERIPLHVEKSFEICAETVEWNRCPSLNHEWVDSVAILGVSRAEKDVTVFVIHMSQICWCVQMHSQWWGPPRWPPYFHKGDIHENDCTGNKADDWVHGSLESGSSQTFTWDYPI